jgi:hypothetical protein
VLADAPDTGQGFSMVRMEVPAGFGGPPPHLHRDFDEAIYALDGELIVSTGSRKGSHRRTAGARVTRRLNPGWPKLPPPSAQQQASWLRRRGASAASLMTELRRRDLDH